MSQLPHLKEVPSYGPDPVCFRETTHVFVQLLMLCMSLEHFLIHFVFPYTCGVYTYAVKSDFGSSAEVSVVRRRSGEDPTRRHLSSAATRARSLQYRRIEKNHCHRPRYLKPSLITPNFSPLFINFPQLSTPHSSATNISSKLY